MTPGDLEKKLKELERSICCRPNPLAKLHNYDTRDDAIADGLVTGDFYYTVVDGESIIKIISPV